MERPVIKIALGDCGGDFYYRSPYLADQICRSWHHALARWLPGIVGPFPSATLDKSAIYSIVREFTMLPEGCQWYLIRDFS